MLVQQHVTRQTRKYPAKKVMPSFLPTHGGALKLSPEANSGPVVQPTTQVLQTIEFVRSGASSLAIWAMVLSEHCNRVVVTQFGELQPASGEV